uniref:Uncharacterized protein n=1 Tax=Klebsiella pneumoniae TaxID=573 RepID=A0A8B0SZG5_KLEPN|nr:hypothetical protein [Klebsiella pneumoniae]
MDCPDEEGRDEFIDHLTGRDRGAGEFFSERTIEIRDKGDRLVLTGNARTLEWHRHVTSPYEIEKDKKHSKKTSIRKQAMRVAGTTTRLHDSCGGKLNSYLSVFVEECWRNHPEVIQAVEKFEYPVFIDEEMALFNADQDAGID